MRGKDESAAVQAPEIRRLLLAAYDAGKRTLPWRGETDPYRIWVSEIMLQQTRVDTVVPYYGRWLERFPDLETLAEAEEDEVLRVWQGLGYYSRARRLQEGAQVVRETLGGVVPGSSEGLRELPGIGEYTAGAVASIAFGEVVPAVDGNVKRVLSRIFDLPSPTPGEYRTLATELVDPLRPGDFNQALMELGALVCTPRSPRCDECPVAPECLALERETVTERPARKKKKRIPEESRAVLVAVRFDSAHGLQLLLRKRPSTGLLAGMWEFPSLEVDVQEGPVPDPAIDPTGGGRGSSRTASPGGPPSGSYQEVAKGLAEGLGFQSDPEDGDPLKALTKLPIVDHVFSHLKVQYRPYLFRAGSRGRFSSLTLDRISLSTQDRAKTGSSPCWISEGSLDQIPVPVAQGKIVMSALAAIND